jgi:hypothetical protein
MERLKFLEKARNLHGYKYEYLDLLDKIKTSDTIKVKFDGVVYYQKVIKHLSGRCPEKVIYKKTTEEYISECKKVWGDKYDYSITKYEGALNNIKVIYNGVVYEQRAKSHLEGLSPEFRKTEDSILNDKINESELIGEDLIKEYLVDNSIDFLYRKKVGDIYFDFYLPKYRTAIEFDGKQHYEPMEYFGGLESYNRLKINDKIKSDYCEDNYIELIRIRYDQLDRVFDILKESLKNKIRY